MTKHERKVKTMEESNATQCALVIEYMKKYGGITTKDADDDLGIMRLGARIHELRQRGLIINDEWVTVINRRGMKRRVKKYWLGGDTNGEETGRDDLLRDGSCNQGA